MRDTFVTSYLCEDCDREYSSLKAAMLCPCDRLDRNGYAH